MALMAGMSLWAAKPVPPRVLSFEERVRAQEAIERVYYSHQIGTTAPFEKGIPRQVLEGKVRTYLKQSVALDRIWHTPVSAEALQRELERIARSTRFAHRLQEVYAALGNDAFVIQECFARPALVDRMSRSFFASDSPIHAEARSQAEELRRRLVSGKLSLDAADSHRTILRLVRVEEIGEKGHVTETPTSTPRDSDLSLKVGKEEFEKIRSDAPQKTGEIGPVLEERDGFVVRIVLQEGPAETKIASYTVPKTTWDAWWSGVEAGLSQEAAQPVASGLFKLPGVSVESASSCVPDDVWDNASLDDIPVGRSGHSAVWTGSLMLIWGGNLSASPTISYLGWRYDPLVDSWSRISQKHAPVARTSHTAVWTGNVMVVWGGKADTPTNAGGRYDPATDTWSPTSLVGAPLPRVNHTAVWTGTQMIVWGGGKGADSSYENPQYNTGGRYDPIADTWSPMSSAPIGQRTYHTAIWTGSEMIVWGGYRTFYLEPNHIQGWDGGARYDPIADTWSGIPCGNSLTRAHHTAVWTGSEMIVWGGIHYSYDFSRDRTTQVLLNTGLRIEPASVTCAQTLADSTAPSARSGHVAVWGANRMMIWGGGGLTLGKRYDPVTNTWNSMASFPSSVDPAAVWTGSNMIVWGGGTNRGGRYDPVADSWTPTATSPNRPGSPVWTGNLMIVWGGRTTPTGDRYDPLTDSWSPTSLNGAPSPRTGNTAVWTGDEMIVWGGQLNTGGRYNPTTDSWLPTSTVGAPAIIAQTAVWTGDRMLVWGRTDSAVGASYDPVLDTWTSISTLGAPSGRDFYTSVWTGARMVIWGGSSAEGRINTGGRYDPVTDSWTSTQISGAPLGRSEHTAIWTGSQMIVWGGLGINSQWLNSGGRYDPVADTWSPTSTSAAPVARSKHTAVWTGSRMIVWGGQSATPERFNTGASYDPVLDDWTPTPTLGAPEPGSPHVAVWSGAQMIVWSGNSGGRYTLVPPTDFDKDGYSVCNGDCDDADPAINPEAVESCDGVDQNCDGIADDGADAVCDDANGCTEDRCGASGCTHTVVPDSTFCSDDDECTLVDECQAGACVGSSLKPCITLTCYVATCNPASGACSSTQQPDGSPCVSGNLCLTNEACQSGFCVGTQVTCSAPDCYMPGTCQPSTGLCSPPVVPKPDGSSCDDGDFCSTGDACRSGVCQGNDPIVLTLNPSALRPANHKMVDVSATLDTCGITSAVLTSVTSSEPDDAPGPSDGHTTSDIQGAEIGTADFNFQLRAEADRNGSGRTYTILYTVTNGSATQTVQGTVLVSLSGKNKPSSLGRKKLIQ